MIRGVLAPICVLAAMGAVGSAAASTNDRASCKFSRPVLLVHGSGLDATSWEPMRRAFLEAGYPEGWLLAVNLLPNDGASIPAAEGQLVPAVARLQRSARSDAVFGRCVRDGKVDIVAHSMGAMSSRWYAARIHPENVRNLVMIAPANHGTDALCGMEGAGNLELCPAFATDASSHLLQTTLNGTADKPVDETPYGRGVDKSGVATIPSDTARRINYTVFWLDPDEWIRPASSALLDGTGGLALRMLPKTAREQPSGSVLWHAGVSHDQFPQDRSVIRVIVSSLMADGAE